MNRGKLIDFVYRLMLPKVRTVPSPSREQRIDWAHGSAVVENPEVTREMVARAVDKTSAAA